jgi:hypothetical protein
MGLSQAAGVERVEEGVGFMVRASDMEDANCIGGGAQDFSVVKAGSLAECRNTAKI